MAIGSGYGLVQGARLASRSSLCGCFLFPFDGRDEWLAWDTCDCGALFCSPLVRRLSQASSHGPSCGQIKPRACHKIKLNGGHFQNPHPVRFAAVPEVAQ